MVPNKYTIYSLSNWSGTDRLRKSHTNTISPAVLLLHCAYTLKYRFLWVYYISWGDFFPTVYIMCAWICFFGVGTAVKAEFCDIIAKTLRYSEVSFINHAHKHYACQLKVAVCQSVTCQASGQLFVHTCHILKYSGWAEFEDVHMVPFEYPTW